MASAPRCQWKCHLPLKWLSQVPRAHDTLSFTLYVDAVAAFLLHNETYSPLTLSIEGICGSGKSSFMLQLEPRVRAAGAKTVWFNAWRHG